MAILRMRVTGDSTSVESLLSRLHSIDKIDRLEEVDDEMSDLRDDSSSADSPDSNVDDVHRVELHIPDRSAKEMIHDVVEMSARDLDVAVEFVDRF